MVTTLISPCGILGYGFPAASLEKALEQSPDAIVVDAGSTDAGPHKLGRGYGHRQPNGGEEGPFPADGGGAAAAHPAGDRLRRRLRGAEAYPVDAGYH